MQMSNSTVQTALFFDVFLYFFDVSEHLALISLNMVICAVYDFGWPVLGGVEGIPLILWNDILSWVLFVLWLEMLCVESLRAATFFLNSSNLLVCFCRSLGFVHNNCNYIGRLLHWQQRFINMARSKMTHGEGPK